VDRRHRHLKIAQKIVVVMANQMIARIKGALAPVREILVPVEPVEVPTFLMLTAVTLGAQ
jgi:hypothetical protein